MSKDFMLSDEERRVARRRRRWIVIIISIVLLATASGFILARPVRNRIRGWQARRHAREALALIDQRKWREARDEASTAYRLQPNEPEALRAVARLLSRAGLAEGLDFWRTLAAVATLNSDDLRDEANLAIQMNDLVIAEDAVQRLLAQAKGKPAPSDLLLNARIAQGRRHFDKAADLANQVLADPTTSRPDQLRAALLLEKVSLPNSSGISQDAGKIGERLATLAKGTDDVSLEALVALASQIIASPANAKILSPIPVDELIGDIDRHPLAKISHRLVAVDLEIAGHPDQKAAIEQRAIDRWKNANNDELYALAAWLYRNGEYQRILDTVSLNRASQTRELFLQYVDALGALSRWDDIRRILESERFPLDPVIQNMYLARCYAQQGQQKGADNNWQRAIESAAGDANKLLMLGEYAEKNNAWQVAATAFDAAAAIAPKSRAAQLGRLRTLFQTHDTNKIHALLTELLKIWPNDTALQNDEAYTRLLLMHENAQQPVTNSQNSSGNEEPITDNPELIAIEHLGEKLLAEEPGSLPHRTLLALTYLKENRPFTALALYKNINVPDNALTPSSVAVHAAVLLAAGETTEARTEIANLHRDRLLPEERALLPVNEPVARQNP